MVALKEDFVVKTEVKPKYEVWCITNNTKILILESIIKQPMIRLTNVIRDE